jgi:hypothetical protein
MDDTEECQHVWEYANEGDEELEHALCTKCGEISYDY